jgi:small subunit ribosomal protein S20
MPIIKSAKKAARQAIKRKAKNEAIKKEIINARKAVLKNPSAENVSAAQSAYDKAFKKGLIKKNTASRRKAKIAKLAKSLSGAKPAKKAVA